MCYVCDYQEFNMHFAKYEDNPCNTSNTVTHPCFFCFFKRKEKKKRFYFWERIKNCEKEKEEKRGRGLNNNVNNEGT
jgi:hypothetical protein